MKWLLSSLVLASLSAHAGLLDHTVYTSEGIHAECSDYLGKVSSGGPITLRDFLIQEQSASTGCSLNARGVVQFLRGNVEKNGNYSCITGARVYTQQVGFSQIGRSHPNYDQLNDEMYLLSQRILAGTTITRNSILDLASARMTGEMVIEGQAGQTQVITILDENPVIAGLGLKIIGTIRPENILWHFPNARTLKIAFSGANTEEYGEHIGLPGTFLAPYAEVTFNNALITGAVYARKLLGFADRQDCYGRVSGQINPASLKIPRSGKPPGKY